jgi:hypothetical protein
VFIYELLAAVSHVLVSLIYPASGPGKESELLNKSCLRTCYKKTLLSSPAWDSGEKIERERQIKEYPFKTFVETKLV